jgi:hypothetical protein
VRAARSCVHIGAQAGAFGKLGQRKQQQRRGQRKRQQRRGPGAPCHVGQLLRGFHNQRRSGGGRNGLASRRRRRLHPCSVAVALRCCYRASPSCAIALRAAALRAWWRGGLRKNAKNWLL